MENQRFELNNRLDRIEDALVQTKLLITLLILLTLMSFYGLIETEEKSVKIALFVLIVIAAGYLLILIVERLFCNKGDSKIDEKRVEKILEDIENKKN